MIRCFYHKAETVNFFLFIYLYMILTRVSPGGIPRDIYILVYSFVFSSLLCFLRVAVVPLGVFMGSDLILVDLAACGIWL
jgi:hypothetical protein